MERRPNMFLVVCFACSLFFAMLADASLWLYSFSSFPSHLQVQASSFANLQPAQSPSHESTAPTFQSFSTSSSPAPAPQSSSSLSASTTPRPFSTSSSSPASAPQTSSSPFASPTSQPFSSSSTAPAPQTSFSPSASPSPSIPDVSGAISQDDPALGDICDKMDYPDLCRSSVVPFLHNKIDHFSVLKLSNDACINHTQAAIHKASELATSNPDATEIVQVCQECYATAVDELKQSALALAARDLGTFRSKMSSVITNIGTCDETFGEDPEMESSSPLTTVDQTITRLASNILAIGERI